MAADLKDRLKMRHSLALAMEIQQRLLPADAAPDRRASTSPGTAPTATRPAATTTTSSSWTRRPRRT